jgi:uncharacterized membrane protein YbhN (UPF0104 family)
LSSPDAQQTSRGWASRVARAPWRLIGILLLVLVILNIDVHAVIARFSRLGLGYVAGAAGAFVALLAARFWRWRVLTIAVGARQPFWALVASCNHSIWLGLATPGRIGEFRRAADLAVVRGWGMAASSSLVLLDLLIDLAAYGAIGLGGYLWVVESSPWGSVAFGAIVLFTALSVIGFGSLVGLLIRFAPSVRKVPGLSELLPALREGLSFSVALKLVIATMLASLAYISMVWCLIHPMQPELPGIYIATAVGLAGIAGAVPITYFGLGTRDVVLIWFFGQIHKLPSDAVAFSFSILLLQLIGIFVSLAAVPLLRAAAARERRENGGSSLLQLQRRKPG